MYDDASLPPFGRKLQLGRGRSDRWRTVSVVLAVTGLFWVHVALTSALTGLALAMLVIHGLGAYGAHQLSRVVELSIEPHGVRIGERWVPRHEIVEVRLERFLKLHWLAVVSERAVLRTPPGGLDVWSLTHLREQLRQLVLTDVEHDAEQAARRKVPRNLEWVAEAHENYVE